MSKRAYRRNRWRYKALLRYLDAKVLRKMKNSMRLSAATWGGNRCAGCGKWVRPAYLSGPMSINFEQTNPETGEVSRGHISLIPYACQWVECPGENDDWEWEETEKLIAKGVV